MLPRVQRGQGGVSMLTPLDIHNKEFSKTFRGYSEAEVDEFLDQVVRSFEELLRTNTEQKARIEELESRVAQYKALEETLNNTLIVAQQAADEVKANAHREADLILEKSRLEASKVLDEGKDKMMRALREFEDIKRQTQVFKARMRSLIASYQEMLDDLVEDDLQATKVV